MPEMMVWLVSSSVRTRKVGSSSDSRCSAVAIFSSSAFDLGSIATSITGSGKSSPRARSGISGRTACRRCVTSLRPIAGRDVAGSRPR